MLVIRLNKKQTLQIAYFSNTKYMLMELLIQKKKPKKNNNNKID